jgi:hypothetical protein
VSDFGWIFATAAPNAAMCGVAKCSRNASIDSHTSKIRSMFGSVTSTENA